MRMDLRNHVLVVPVAPHDLHEGQVVASGTRIRSFLSFIETGWIAIFVVVGPVGHARLLDWHREPGRRSRVGRRLGHGARHVVPGVDVLRARGRPILERGRGAADHENLRRFIDEQVHGPHEPDQFLARVLAECAHAYTRAALRNIDAKLSADMFMRKPQRLAAGGVFSSASRRSVALRNLKNCDARFRRRASRRERSRLAREGPISRKLGAEVEEEPERSSLAAFPSQRRSRPKSRRLRVR